MVMNTPYLGTPLDGENYQSSTGTTVLSSLSVSGPVDASRVSTTHVDLFNSAGTLSMATVANDNNLIAGELRLVFQASGLSLVYSSGDSTYIVNSAVSSAQG